MERYTLTLQNKPVIVKVSKLRHCFRKNWENYTTRLRVNLRCTKALLSRNKCSHRDAQYQTLLLRLEVSEAHVLSLASRLKRKTRSLRRCSRDITSSVADLSVPLDSVSEKLVPLHFRPFCSVRVGPLINPTCLK